MRPPPPAAALQFPGPLLPRYSNIRKNCARLTLVFTSDDVKENADVIALVDGLDPADDDCRIITESDEDAFTQDLLRIVGARCLGLGAA